MRRRSRFRHPLFARLFSLLAPQLDQAGAAEHRRKLLAGLSGTVVEVGAGSGLNFPHYPRAVEAVVAVEPEPYLASRAVEAAASAPVPVAVLRADAHRLPFSEGSFNAAVASLVLCSVDDPAAVLEEIRRVLRVGGELRFYEHVVSTHPPKARFQRRLDLVWPYLSGGCHTSRDTVSGIRRAGFDIESLERFSWAPSPLAKPVSPHVIGLARRSS